MNNKLLDVILLPKQFFARLTDKKSGLIPGILLVGFIDIGLHFILFLSKYVMGKSQSVFLYNISLMLVEIIVIGLIDILFFCIPLFDICRYIKRKYDEGTGSISPAKVMKVYIMPHIVTLPVQILLLLPFYFDPNLKALLEATSMTGINLTGTEQFFLNISAVMNLFIIPIWFSAIITRGLGVLFNFKPSHRRVIFILVYIWATLFGYALGYVIGWGKVLFR